MMENKVALISGGTSGIGLATAVWLLGKGARVVISGRSREKGEQALTQLGCEERCFFAAADVAEDASCRRLAVQAVKRWGRLDILVNSAGFYLEQCLAETTPEQLQRLLAVNVWEPIIFAVMPCLRCAARKEILSMWLLTPPCMVMWAAALTALLKGRLWPLLVPWRWRLRPMKCGSTASARGMCGRLFWTSSSKRLFIRKKR